MSPRIRTVKPEFWADEKLGPMSPIDRLVFLGLISMADDLGRLVDSVKQIDAFLFPYTDDSSRESLATLSGNGRIERGETAAGQRIIQIANWSHQKVDHPNIKAALPPITKGVSAPLARDSRGIREGFATLSVPVPTTSTNDQRPKPTPPPPAREPDSVPEPSPQRAALEDRVRAIPNGVETLTRFLNGRPGTHEEVGWCARIDGWIDGMGAARGKALSPAAVVDGLSDYLVQSDRDYSAMHVRSFLERAQGRLDRPDAPAAPYQPRGQKPNAGAQQFANIVAGLEARGRKPA